MRITLYRSVTDTSTATTQELPWSRFVLALSTHARREHKDGPGFSPATFAPGSTRNGEGVLELHALVLDVDKIDESGALEALARLQARGVRCAWHTTHSHAPPEKASLRVAFPLSRPVPAAEWRRFYRAAAESLGIPFEKKCINPDRFWYLPSCPIDAEPESGSFEGEALDVDAILASAPEEIVEPTRTTGEPSTFGPADGATLREVQRYLTEHGPAITGQGADHHVYRAAAIAVNDFGLSELEAMSVLTVWNADNVPPWDEAGLREKVAHAARYAQNEAGSARRSFEEQRSIVGAFATPREPEEEPQPVAGSWAADFLQAKRDVAALLANMPAEGAEPPALFERASDVVGRDHPPTPWRVRGLMTKGGTTMIAGGPKTSKTWAELEIFIAITTGTKAFGEFETGEPCLGALFLAEDDAAAFTVRVRALARGRGTELVEATRNMFVQPRGRALDLLKLDDLALVVASCRRLGPVRIVGLDPLRDVHSGEEDKSDSMSVVMRNARAIGTLLGADVFLVHHMGKPSENGGAKKNGGQKMRGSGAIHGSVDSGIYIHDVKTDGETSFANRMESQVKAGKSTGFFNLTLTIEDDANGQARIATWAYSKGEAKPVGEAALEPSEDDAAVLAAVNDCIAADRDVTRTDVAQLTGRRKADVLQSVQRLLNMKKLHEVVKDPLTGKLYKGGARLYTKKPRPPTMASIDPSSVASEFLQGRHKE